MYHGPGSYKPGHALLFETVGKVVTIIDEKLMDAATVLGACGTAFAMRYIRANIQGGIEIGFDAVNCRFDRRTNGERCSRTVTS